MKKKVLTIKKHNLLKIYIIILQLYTKKIAKSPVNFHLNNIVGDIEMQFRIALKIIYEYHCNKRKILFLDTNTQSNNLLSNIIRKTNHYYIPTDFWIPGILKNFSSIKTQLFCPKISESNTQKSKDVKKLKSVLKLQRQPDLVVILDNQLEYKILKEIYNLNIPTISFNNSKYSNNVSYQMLEYLTLINKRNVGIYTFILYCIFKRLVKI